MLQFDKQVVLPTLGEADYVHDVAFDFYGSRIAVCTSSLRISVFSVPQPHSEANVQNLPTLSRVTSGDFRAPQAQGDHRDGTVIGGGWTEVARMDRAHNGPIWRLSWGHPEYGEPLASVSEDRTVRIWYCPRLTPSAVAGQTQSATPFAAPAGSRGAEFILAMQSTTVPGKWPERAHLSWDITPISPFVDVRWAPAPLGIKFAVCTADGRARVWECVNSLDLREWEGEELELPHQRTAPSAAAAIFGRAAHRPSAAAPSTAAAAAAPLTCRSAALDWMPVPHGGGMGGDREAIALGGRGGRLAIWVKENRAGKWKELASAEAHRVEDGGIKDVAWCPNLSRPYEVVATCGAGAALWRVELSLPSGGGDRREHNPTCQLQQLKELIPAGERCCPIWRCGWSLTGTALALTPEGAEVMVWKTDANLDWRCECGVNVSGEDCNEPPEAADPVDEAAADEAAAAAKAAPGAAASSASPNVSPSATAPGAPAAAAAKQE